MDAQARKKAAFRAILKTRKQEKQRIDTPLQKAVKTYKANALKANAVVLATKTETAKELPKPKPESSRDLIDKSEPSTTLRTHQSSTLPSDFFDNRDKERLKNERGSRHYGDPRSKMRDSVSANTQVSEGGTDRSSTAPSTQTRNPEVQVSKDSKQVSGTATALESKEVKGALPAGFFDDKDSDLRARGIKIVKPDVKDEYKEFEKLILEDIQEIDDRMEEEEFVAAEVIEEEEMVVQRAYIERVEMLRKKKLELRHSRSVVVANDTEVTRNESSREDSSSDEEEDDFKVDWRAKRL